MAMAAAANIQSEVEEIIKSEFNPNCELNLHKYQLPDDLKAQTEKQVHQKFFDSYLYIGKICDQDSLKEFAALDNTYGMSQTISFLVIFSQAGNYTGRYYPISRTL